MINAIDQIAPSLKDYFDINETGITPLEQNPSVLALETLGYALKTLSRDAIRWWVGDWAIMTQRKGAGTYEILAAKIWEGHYEGNSIETIAYVCRNVEKEIRRPELSFWFHKLVAPLEPEKQTELLDTAIKQKLSFARFSKLVSGKSQDEPLTGTRADDRLHELEMEINETRKALQREVDQYKAEADNAKVQLSAYKTKINKVFDNIDLVLEYLEEMQAPEMIMNAQLEAKKILSSELS